MGMALRLCSCGARVQDDRHGPAWPHMVHYLMPYSISQQLCQCHTCVFSHVKHMAGVLQILHKVRGSVLPGEVLALMGPSGSGKTSLVSVLGGRVPQGMTLGGQIEFNKEPLNRKMKRSIGYVLQDDALFSALTVYETLYYAARLRLPRDMPMCAAASSLDCSVT